MNAPLTSNPMKLVRALSIAAEGPLAVKLHVDSLEEAHTLQAHLSSLITAPVETTAKAARDADHCDYPDCEQHYSAVVANIGVVTNRPLPPDRQGCVNFLVEIARIVKAAQSPVKSGAES